MEYFVESRGRIGVADDNDGKEHAILRTHRRLERPA